MKKYFLLCTIYFVALVGCEETAKKVYLPSVVNIDATAVCCDVANPVDNLPWLHDIVYDFMADSLIRKEEMAYFNILRVYVCTQMEEDNILILCKNLLFRFLMGRTTNECYVTRKRIGSSRTTAREEKDATLASPASTA